MSNGDDQSKHDTFGTEMPTKAKKKGSKKKAVKKAKGVKKKAAKKR